MRTIDGRTEMHAALAAQGPHPALGRQARLFNRLIGTWDFECSLDTSSGGVTRFRGEWSFGWVLDGRVLQDVWIGHHGSAEPGSRGVGTSLRFYDSTAGTWKQVWLAPTRGQVRMLEGGSRGQGIVFEGRDSSGPAVRWSFLEIEEDSFVWHGEEWMPRAHTWRMKQIIRARRRRSASST